MLNIQSTIGGDDPYSVPLQPDLWLTQDGSVPSRAWFLHRLHHHFTNDIIGHSFVALTWKFHTLAETNTGLILVHLLGLDLAGWSCLFPLLSGSPHLAAVASTFLLVFAILALVIKSSQSGTLSPPSFYIFALKTIRGHENHPFPTNLLRRNPDTYTSFVYFIFQIP